MPFRALGLGPGILRAIQEAGYTEPTPIQIQAIPVILTRRDIIATAQTGTGKTAAYMLPILERLTGLAHAEPQPAPVARHAASPGHSHAASRHASPAPAGRHFARVLILVPTRELAVQVEESVRLYARKTPIRCVSVYGGVGETPQIKALRTGVDIVVATPGRLMDLLRTLPDTFRQLDTLVLDEADRMLDMGFLPDIRRIVRPLPKERQTLMFSATFSDPIEQVSREFLRNPQTVSVGRRASPTHTVTQFVYEVPPTKKIPLLVHLLKDQKLDTVLVFTRTKRGADKLASRLEDEGFTTATLHSNKSQSQRQAALKGFKSGRYRLLVATDIAARGIDVDGISHVVNYDFPAQPEDYVHRIGRTGRAAAIGDALSFVTPEDHGALRALEHFIGRGIPRMAVEGLAELKSAPRSHAEARPEPSRGHGASRPRRGEDAPRGRGQDSRGGGGGGGRRSGGRPESGYGGNAGRSQSFGQGGGTGRSRSQESPGRGSRGSQGSGSGSGTHPPRRPGGPDRERSQRRPAEAGRQERGNDRTRDSGRAAPAGRPRHEEEAPTTLWGRLGRAVRGRKPGSGR